MEDRLFDSPLYRRPRRGRKAALVALAVIVAAVGTGVSFVCPYAIPLLFAAALPFLP